MFLEYGQKKNSTSLKEKEIFCLYSIRKKILERFLRVREKEEKTYSQGFEEEREREKIET